MILSGIDIDAIIRFSSDYLYGEHITFFLVCILVSVIAIIIGFIARGYSSDRRKKRIERKIIKLSKQIQKESENVDTNLAKINSLIAEFESNSQIQVAQEELTDEYLESIKAEKEKYKLLKSYKKLLDERNVIEEKKKLKKLAYKLTECEYDINEWPFPKPRGFYNFMEIYVSFLEKQVLEIMDYRFINFTGYILGLTMFMLLSFLLGIAGFPNPFTVLSSTLTIGLITFVMIHATAVHYNHLKYFKRYTDPVPFFLPINLLSMWSPLISLSLRLFGNALAGWALSTLIYYSFYSLGVWFIAPVITPVLHAYFDVFSGVIQTLVFTMLSMIFISQEAPQLKEEEKVKMGSYYR